MSKFATPFRFEDDGTGRGGGSWYNPPPALYHPDGVTFVEMPLERVRVFRELTMGLIAAPAAPRSDAGPKILVAGCGYGYVCWHLWDQGYSAWGMDTAWAQGQARTGGKLPNISDHILQGDCTVAADVANVRSQAGIGTNARFAGVITDDLLSAADSTAEAGTMLSNLRSAAMPSQANQRNRVVHFISMYDAAQPWSGALPGGDAGAVEGLYRGEAEWVTTIGSNTERIVNIASNRIVR